jgi:alanine dehydrogenase
LADPAGPALTFRFVAGPDVDALGVPRAEILAAVEGAVRAQGEGQVVLEPRVHLAPPNGGAGHFNVLRGHLGPEHVSGVKVVGDFVGNWRLGLPSELALVLLLDPGTGMPLGIVDGTMLTAARTGALTALGAKHLARPDSRVLGHLGARGSAWWNVTMLDDLFDFEEIRVTSRRAESREGFAARLTEPQVLLETAWVTPGTTVIPYGTVSAVDLDLVEVMDKVVVDDWGQATAGPLGALRRHVDSGRLGRHNLHAELGEIVAGRAQGRERPEERILFWHRGLATTDLAVASLLLRRAAAAGLGTLLRYR